MAVGPNPNLHGNLTAGAPCSSCGGEASMNNAMKYQEYGGQFAPSGMPLPPCGPQGNCGQSGYYSPSTGGPGK